MYFASILEKKLGVIRQPLFTLSYCNELGRTYSLKYIKYIYRHINSLYIITQVCVYIYIHKRRHIHVYSDTDNVYSLYSMKFGSASY